MMYRRFSWGWIVRVRWAGGGEVGGGEVGRSGREGFSVSGYK